MHVYVKNNTKNSAHTFSFKICVMILSYFLIRSGATLLFLFFLLGGAAFLFIFFVSRGAPFLFIFLLVVVPGCYATIPTVAQNSFELGS